jgi:hypothetical protein
MNPTVFYTEDPKEVQLSCPVISVGRQTTTG